MSIDTVGNFLTCIRNALMIKKRLVITPHSKMRLAIANILKEEGFIKDVKKIDAASKKPALQLFLKYVDNQSVIHEIARVSKPGCRRYEGSKELTSVIGGLGVSILTTNAGVITDKKAKQLMIGGEILCHVW